MEKINWIWQMSEAVEHRNYDDIKVLCEKVENEQWDEPCYSFCPFVHICDWIENLMHCLPDGTVI